MIRLEVCVDSPAGLDTAIAAGADRIELCAALDLGGLTPSPGLMALAATAPVQVYAMIRPRGGRFVFTPRELAAMEADIAAARAANLAGVVLGASLDDGRLDAAMLARLVSSAQGLGMTLHRAFDLTPDLGVALETAIALGFERILTSGGALRAPAGTVALSFLVRQAQRRISIMAGSGVTPENALELVRATGVGEIHASCRTARAVPPDPALAAFGFEASDARETDGTAVAELFRAIGR